MTSTFVGMGCGCNFLFEVGSGGALCGGAADVYCTGVTMEGGIVCGGASAYDDVVDEPFDGLCGCWHLQELGSGAANEYQDSSPKGLHGQGGDGTASMVPTREDAVFCLQSQAFDGSDDFIQFPPDDIGNQSFSVSLWTKLEGFYKQASWFARGHDTTSGDKWVFNFSHSVMNHLMARYNLTDGTSFTQFIGASRHVLQVNRWFHIAVNFDRDQGRSITFINGSADYTNDTTSTDALVSLTNDGFMGKSPQSGFFFSTGLEGLNGNMLEVRLFPEAKDEVWFKAEYDNWCDPNFVLIGEEESVTAPIY